MQEHFSGIVIQKYDSGDHDLVLHVMSASHGKISIIAKQAKKSSRRFGTRIDLFDQGTFWVSQKSQALPILANFEASASFKNLRSDMDKLILASVLSEAVDLLVKEDSQHEAPVHEALLLGLRAIEESTDLTESLRAAYLSLSHILAQTGINDLERHNRPSTAAFIALIDRLEFFVEKRLKTRTAFLGVIEQFKKSSSSSAA